MLFFFKKREIEDGMEKQMRHDEKLEYDTWDSLRLNGRSIMLCGL